MIKNACIYLGLMAVILVMGFILALIHCLPRGKFKDRAMDWFDSWTEGPPKEGA